MSVCKYDKDTDTLTKVAGNATLGGLVVSEFGTTPSDTKVPSEKLVKDNFDSVSTGKTNYCTITGSSTDEYVSNFVRNNWTTKFSNGNYIAGIFIKNNYLAIVNKKDDNFGSVLIMNFNKFIIGQIYEGTWTWKNVSLESV